jgi:hypothetical protein
MSGSPVGKPAFVKADLEKRLAKLEVTATKLEDLIADGSRGALWQGMLQLVQQCVATKHPHLARSLPTCKSTFAWLHCFGSQQSRVSPPCNSTTWRSGAPASCSQSSVEESSGTYACANSC